ncbi:hypothetical protein LINPERHAP2_LOCUS7785 [Linum perenne]
MPMHLLFSLYLSPFDVIGRCKLFMFTETIIMSQTSLLIGSLFVYYSLSYWLLYEQLDISKNK